jgi:hypothetical protein
VTAQSPFMTLRCNSEQDRMINSSGAVVWVCGTNADDRGMERDHRKPFSDGEEKQ